MKFLESQYDNVNNVFSFLKVFRVTSSLEFNLALLDVHVKLEVSLTTRTETN